jgi:uncharacterized membrane protein YdbT with pleckstrin-like domain
VTTGAVVDVDEDSLSTAGAEAEAVVVVVVVVLVVLVLLICWSFSRKTPTFDFFLKNTNGDFSFKKSPCETPHLHQT